MSSTTARLIRAKLRLPAECVLRTIGTSHALWTGMVKETLGRRGVLRGALGLGGLMASGSSLAAGCSDDREPRNGTAPLSLRYKGMNYDVGTDSANEVSRPNWNPELMKRDIRAIRDDLRCNAIAIHGTSMRRLIETSEFALESGLQVWLQPRLFDVSTEELFIQLSSAAGEAERLRQHYQKIHLNVGVEMTLLNTGFVPGNGFFERVANFGPNTDWPEVIRKLNVALEQARTVARAKFNGPLTYSAGEWEWEAIEWDDFDVIGIDHYMDETNRGEYVEKLRFFTSLEKPVVVQEFGCCTYQGAENAGGMGWAIVDQESPDRLNGEYVRSEQTQADYISRLLDIFHQERLGGAFIYQFVSPDTVHSSDPQHDMDMASYGVVKVVEYDSATGAYRWEPKQSFHEVARRFSAA